MIVLNISLITALLLKKLKKYVLARRWCSGQNLKANTRFIRFWAKQMPDFTCFVLSFDFQMEMDTRSQPDR